MKKFKLLFSSLAVIVISGCVAGSGDSLIGRNPKAADINVRLGLNYLQQGAYEQANIKLGRALKQAPNSADANWAFAVLQETIEQPNEAHVYYNKALDLAPGSPDILNSYGSFLCKQGDTTEAFSKFEQIVTNKLYSTPEVVLTNGGVCALTVQDTQLAETYFRRALKANPRYSSALYQMSLLSFKSGRYLVSRAYRERLTDVLSRPDPKVLYLCAKTEERLGNTHGALRCARKLKSDFPSSEEARTFY